MSYRIDLDGEESEAQILARRPHLQVQLGETRHVLEAGSAAAAAQFALSVDGVRYRGWRYVSESAVHVRLEGRTYVVHFPRRASQGEGAAAQAQIRASMPGVVVAVHCAAGQSVQAGDKLLTLESMKLQMTVVASHASTVREVHVVAQAVFERGALLVSFATEEPADA
jgi:acetyl/propionyl-CoA carboxylase alpha subunit